MAKKESEHVISKKINWKELRKYPNILNMGISTKFVDGKDTGVECITFYVSKKLKTSLLSPDETVPSEVEGIPTDVVELSADYEIGETGISKKHPDIQRRLAGGVKVN